MAKLAALRATARSCQALTRRSARPLSAGVSIMAPRLARSTRPAESRAPRGPPGDRRWPAGISPPAPGATETHARRDRNARPRYDLVTARRRMGDMTLAAPSRGTGLAARAAGLSIIVPLHNEE